MFWSHLLTKRLGLAVASSCKQVGLLSKDFEYTVTVLRRQDWLPARPGVVVNRQATPNCHNTSGLQTHVTQACVHCPAGCGTYMRSAMLTHDCDMNRSTNLPVPNQN